MCVTIPMTYLQADRKHIELKDRSVVGKIPGFTVRSIGKQILTLLMGCVTLGCLITSLSLYFSN